MAKDSAERSRIGRTALGGAACGLTYDAALQDAVAREDRLRRPLRLHRWQSATHHAPTTDPDRKPAEYARSDASA